MAVNHKPSDVAENRKLQDECWMPPALIT